MSFAVGVAGIFSTQEYTIGDKTSSELPFDTVENTKTVENFTYGADKTYDGMLNAEKIEDSAKVEKITSYEILFI